MASKDTHDPGWNDPPIFTYDKATAMQAAASTKKGISLNKRVAFPMSGPVVGKQDNCQANPSGDLTKPPPMSHPPSVVPTGKPAASPQVDSTIVAKDRLEMVLKNLQIEENCDDEIVKRIRIMEKMWNENKLDEVIQLRIYELSEALAKGDPETADHIQKGLMVDYISQCSSWMSGIRHLINKNRNVKS